MAKHARTLSDAEFDALVAHVQRKRNGARNRLVVFLTHYAGMRIGECSSLLHSDLIGRSYEGVADFYHNNIGYKVVQQIQLRKRAVKGKHARSVVLNERVRREIV